MSNIPILTPAEIKAIRDEQGLTQDEFCTRYKLRLRTLHGWERGAREPSVAASLLLRVIKAYPEKVAAELANVVIIA